MVNQRSQIIATLLSALCMFISMVWIMAFTDFTPNNKFVAVLTVAFFEVAILAYTWIQERILRIVSISTAIMFSFAFTLVPLYNVFCDVTGLNGKVDLQMAAANQDGIDDSREITVEFVVNHNQKMPWEFKPKHTSIKVHPGEMVPTAYFAKNPTKKTMIGQAIPSITPSKASKYLKKVECFCFSSQKLAPGQSSYLGLTFYLDKNIPKDIHRLTLAYTIFDVTKNAKDNSINHHT